MTFLFLRPQEGLLAVKKKTKTNPIIPNLVGN